MERLVVDEVHVEEVVVKVLVSERLVVDELDAEVLVVELAVVEELLEEVVLLLTVEEDVFVSVD